MINQIFVLIIIACGLALLWVEKLKKFRLPLATLIVLLPFVTVFFEQSRFQLDYFWWRVAGAIAILLGVLIVSWSKIYFLKLGLLPTQQPDQLLTKGPYQFFRHPMYLGTIFIYVGWWWLWSAAYSFYFGMFILALIWIQAHLEEKLLLIPKFGSEYEEYRSQTGMFWVK